MEVLTPANGPSLELSDGVSAIPLPEPQVTPSVARTVSKNVAFSLARVAVNSLVALGLPAYLTHRLPRDTYAAWTLILQLAAFVSFLDFGIQTAIAKFIAEHTEQRNWQKASRYASAGLLLLSGTGTVGAIFAVVLSTQVPHLFRSMPQSLYQDARWGVLLIGVSLSFNLISSAYAGVFLGLQRYAIPMGIAIANKTAFFVVVCVAVFLHARLTVMSLGVAAVNVFSGITLIALWGRRSSKSVHVSWQRVRPELKEMTGYTALMAIWTLGMLCVNGLDLTIVGHFDYPATAYYSVASLPTAFLVTIMSATIGPMMPASSALGATRSPEEMGTILIRATRYMTTLLLLAGLPLIVWSFPVLHAWVGPVYAAGSVHFLRILALANIIRMLCAPYATMVAAGGRLRYATWTAISEAVVNLTVSLLLAPRIGAIGVAYGTLFGSVVSVLLHFVLTMRETAKFLHAPRWTLFHLGMLRPAILTLPSFAYGVAVAWNIHLPLLAAVSSWAASTLSLAWFGCFKRDERRAIVQVGRARLIST